MALKQHFSHYELATGAIAAVATVATVVTGFGLWRLFGEESGVPPALHWVAGSGLVGLDLLLVGSVATFAIARISQYQQRQVERLRSIFEGAAIGIGLDSLDGKILESNPALQQMLGYSHAELAQMSFADFTHPDDRAMDLELFNDLINGHRDCYQFEKRQISKNGKTIWIRLTNSVVRNHQGLPQYTVAIAENITQLNQARASIQRYADIVKQMQVGLLVWQLENPKDLTSYRLIECNPAASQILQLKTPIADLLGQPMSVVFPELAGTAFPRIYADVIQSGQERDLGEIRYGDATIPDGIFATKAFPLPNRCVGLVFDNITERKQAEYALQQSEARFRVVADTASCAFLVYQGNHLRYVNPATTDITGYSEDELMAMPFWELAHPDFQPLVRDRGLARQRGDTVPRRYDIKIVTKSGEIRWVDMTAGTAMLDGQPAALATAYDITERKAAEAQLQLAADRERLLSEIALRIRRSLDLKEILNTTVAEIRQFLQADRVFIAQLTPESPCRTVAESVDAPWSSILGWEADMTAVAEIRRLFQPDTVRVVNDTAEIAKTPFLKEYYGRCQVKAGMGVPIMLDDEMFGVLIVNQCSQTRVWQPFEIDLLEKLGTQVEIAIQQGQLYQRLLNLAASLEGQVNDRTQELQQRMQELQELNQVKDILLHAVTHDLRTPVHGMLMVLNHLRDRCCDETVTLSRAMVERMIESSDRQLNLLNFLTESHSSSSCPQQGLCCTPLTLRPVVEAALHKLATLLERNDAIVVDQVSADLPTITADGARLQQVWENLIANAVKHNLPGRTITLTATLTTASNEEAERPQIYCTVADNGRGMTAEQCDRLFDLYVRGLDNHHLTGIGLGLHRCKHIITKHGGTIGVHSQPDQGTTVWFTLPLATQSAPA